MGFAADVKDSFKAMGDQARKVDPRGISKIWLRIILIVFYFVIAGCIGRMIPDAYGLFNYGQAGYYFMPLGLAFVWAVTAIVYPLQQEKPIRAYVSVSMDTIFLLGFIVVAVLQTRAARIAYNYQQHQAQYNIGPLFDMPPTVGTMYDAAPVMGALGRTGKATAAQLMSISQSKVYTYTTTPPFASLNNLGFNIMREPGNPDYLCPNWDSCHSRDQALYGFNYTPKLGLAAGILFCILCLLQLVQVVLNLLDVVKPKDRRTD